MSESRSAEMIKDMIRDCVEDAERVAKDGDSYQGSMLFEGHCSGFRDLDLAHSSPGTAGFEFTQDGVTYLVYVLAIRPPSPEKES